MASEESAEDYLLLPTFADAKLRSVIWHKCSANSHNLLLFSCLNITSNEQTFKWNQICLSSLWGGGVVWVTVAMPSAVNKCLWDAVPCTSIRGHTPCIVQGNPTNKRPPNIFYGHLWLAALFWLLWKRIKNQIYWPWKVDITEVSRWSTGARNHVSPLFKGWFSIPCANWNITATFIISI